VLTEQALVQLRRAQLASGVALYAALGGGFVNTAFDTNAAQTGGQAR
jgi:outer membrane protein TolC